MPRFTILRHDSRRGLHWDFMLECGSVLRTWALPEPPAAALTMMTTELPDHRLAYLDYEGPVSGDRGTVACWDRGVYEVETQGEDELRVMLCGTHFHGRVTLTKQSDGAWVLQVSDGDPSRPCGARCPSG
jgi:hypothetical protein